MNISIGDMADRHSICSLKQERAKVDCSAEISALEAELNALEPPIDFNLHRLYEVNGHIWDLESDIRKGKEGILGLEEVGRRALAIRDWNNVRVRLKNEINLKYKSGFQEIKKDHASA